MWSLPLSPSFNCQKITRSESHERWTQIRLENILTSLLRPTYCSNLIIFFGKSTNEFHAIGGISHQWHVNLCLFVVRRAFVSSIWWLSRIYINVFSNEFSFYKWCMKQTHPKLPDPHPRSSHHSHKLDATLDLTPMRRKHSHLIDIDVTLRRRFDPFLFPIHHIKFI